MRLEELKKYVNDNPPVATVGCFAVQTQATNEAGQTSYRWRTLPYSLLHDGFVRGDINYVHEVFLDWRPVKPFWDVDMTRSDYHENFLNGFIGRVSEGLDFSSDRDDYAIMETIYPMDIDKVSFHIVLNDGTVFQSSQMFLRYMQGKNFNVDILHIDTNIYRSSGSMRCPGSTKWVRGRPPYPKLIQGIFHKECTYAQYVRCLAQVLPHNQRMIRMEGFEAEVARARRFVQGAVRRESAISEVLRVIQDDPRNLDIDLQATGVSSVAANIEESTPAYTSFTIANAQGFGSCNHSLSCIYRTESQVLMVRCGNGVCGDQIIGVTEFARQMLRETRYMDFLAIHNLDRPDFLLKGTKRDVGYFALTEREFWAMIKEQIRPCNIPNCGLCQNDEFLGMDELVVPFYISERNPTMCSLEAFNWLKAEYPGDMRKLVTYCNFTFCVKGSKIWMRKLDQFGELTQQEAKIVFAPLQYDVWSPPKSKAALALYLSTGEGGTICHKPFFDYWMKDQFTRRFDSMTKGVLDFSPGSQFNCITPLAADLNQAVAEYESCSIAEQNMLSAVWDSYMNMLVSLEEGDTKRKARRYCERFIFEAVFHFAEKKHGHIVLVSETGGQGKSSLGDLICMILGPNHSSSTQADGFFEEIFNKGSNGFVHWEEAVVSKKDSEKLKARMTQDTVSIRAMRQDKEPEPNRTSFLISTNREFLPFLNGPGMDRRTEILQIPDIVDLDEMSIFDYGCIFCDADPGMVCGHSFLNHAQWLQILRGNIISYTNQRQVHGEKFFLPFLGMMKKLYARRIAQFPDFYEQTLDFDKPQTSAGDKTRAKCADLAVKFMKACFARGFHSEMHDDPPQSLHKIPVLFPTYQVDAYEADQANPNKTRKWAHFVTKEQVYFAFKVWCKAENVKPLSSEIFEADLRRYHKTLLRSSIVEVTRDCLKLEYQKDQFGDFKWTPVRNPQYAGIACFDFGAKPWDQVDVPRQRAQVPKRAALLRSSSLAGLSPENSLSNDILPADTRQALMFDRANPRVDLSDIYSVLQEDDACDGFDAGLERTRRIREQDLSDIDEDEQDAIAEYYDTESRKRRKQAGHWLDQQAEEVEEPEDDDLMEESE